MRRSIKETKRETYWKYHEALMSQVGQIATSWATFEMLFDVLISMIHRHGGDKAVQPDLSASLKTKIAYLRKAPRVMPVVINLRTEANRFADKIQILKEARHDCLHGILLIDPDDYTVLVVRLRYEGPNLRTGGRRLTFEEINQAVLATMTLCEAGSTLFGRFAEAFQDKEAIKSFRKLAVSVPAVAIEQKD